MEALIKLFQKKTTPAALGSDSINPRRIMPYAAQLGDGGMQLQFTLPLKASPEAREAAQRYLEKLPLRQVQVLSMEAAGEQSSFFLARGHAKHAIDSTKIKAKAATAAPSLSSMGAKILERFKRPLYVAAISLEAPPLPSVLPALLTLAGHRDDPGLESYECFRVKHFYQENFERSLNQLLELKFDILLVGQGEAKRASDWENSKRIVEELKNQRGALSTIKVLIAPQMTQAKALKLGFEGGFGPQLLPRELAGFLMETSLKLA